MVAAQTEKVSQKEENIAQLRASAAEQANARKELEEKVSRLEQELEEQKTSASQTRAEAATLQQ